jgi:hypothetical protein
VLATLTVPYLGILVVRGLPPYPMWTATNVTVRMKHALAKNNVVVLLICGEAMRWCSPNAMSYLPCASTAGEIFSVIALERSQHLCFTQG